MRKPKLLVYLAIIAVPVAFLSWYINIIGLVAAIPIIVLSHIELKNSIATNYSPQDIKYLKIARLFAIISLIISILIILFEASVLVFSIVSYFSY